MCIRAGRDQVRLGLLDPIAVVIVLITGGTAVTVGHLRKLVFTVVRVGRTVDGGQPVTYPIVGITFFVQGGIAGTDQSVEAVITIQLVLGLALLRCVYVDVGPLPLTTPIPTCPKPAAASGKKHA